LTPISNGYKGALQCNPNYGGCPGSNNGNCWPNHVWSGVPRSEEYYSAFALKSGTLTMDGVCDGTGKCFYTNAFAVRCVLDLEFPGAQDVLGMRTVKKITKL